MGARKLSEAALSSLKLFPPPPAAQVAEGCRLARTVLRYVLPNLTEPGRAVLAAEGWLRAGAQALGYPAVEVAQAAAAGAREYSAAVAARAAPGSAERLAADLSAQAAEAARCACAGNVAGVRECLRAIAVLTSSTEGEYTEISDKRPCHAVHSLGAANYYCHFCEELLGGDRGMP